MQFADSQERELGRAVRSPQSSGEGTRARRAPIALGIIMFVGILIGMGPGFALGVWSQQCEYECSPEGPVSAPSSIPDTIRAAATSTPRDRPGEPSNTPTATPMPSPTMASLSPSTAVLDPTPTPSFFEGPLVYGYSVQQRPLAAYRLGSGPSARAIIGGIHGGYEWNTVEFVSDTLDYLTQNRHLVPPEVTLYLIPNMNPDGYVAGRDAVKGRMNANLVDLNRNWDYEWQETATHGSRPVKAGSAPFSEPETLATRDFILDRGIEYVIFYHSAMGVVFSGADRDHSATYQLTEMLSEATGYPHRTEGVPGQITTGDAIDWLSTVGIAATEIELTTHDLIDEAEQERNLAGVRAFLNWPEPVMVEHSLGGDGMWWTTHTVQSGESLLEIAYYYGIEPGTSGYELLLTTNGIEDEDAIKAGDTIRVALPENRPVGQ